MTCERLFVENLFEEVVAVSSERIATDGNDSAAFKWRGMARLALGDIDCATRDLSQAVKLLPLDRELQQAFEDVQGAVFCRPNRPYFFVKGQLPRVRCQDVAALHGHLSHERAVVICESRLVASATNIWTVDFLAKNIGDDPMTVFVSQTHKFMYYNLAHNTGNYPFTPPTTEVKMSFPEFRELLVASAELEPSQRDQHYYLQQKLSKDVGPAIIDCFSAFDWPWLLALNEKYEWEQLQCNLLLVGARGNITPCHYDEQHNIFAQLVGRKRVVLFPPSAFPCLYPFPVHHAADRQCQVDFDAPNFERYPKFRQAEGREVILEPGELLYIPPYWFHYVENIDISVSLTFWFPCNNTKNDINNISEGQLLAMKRNVEKLVATAIGGEALPKFFQDLTLGRFIFPS